MARLKSIIEQQFFPQLKKYHLEDAYLDACNRNDMSSMLVLTQELYEFDRTEQQNTNLSPSKDFSTSREVDSSKIISSSDRLPVLKTLEEFVETFSSQDNASFHAIMDEEALKRKLWMEKHFTKRTLENTPMLKYTISDPLNAMYGIPEHKTLPLPSVEGRLLLLPSSCPGREPRSSSLIPNLHLEGNSNINFNNTRFDSILSGTYPRTSDILQNFDEQPLSNPIKFDMDSRKRNFI